MDRRENQMKKPNITEDMRILRRLLSSHPERVAAGHVVDVLNRAQTALETQDCQSNCMASREEDFSAGWKAAQEFDEAIDDLAGQGMRVIELPAAFEAHIKAG